VIEVPRLHAVTDDAIAARPDAESLARAIARPGTAVHARAPGLEGRAHLEFATRIIAAARAGGAVGVVNDRVDVARATGAHAVHLPAHGLPVDAVRPLVPGLLVGGSVHSADGARRAADLGADYVFLGPIWETPSHPGRGALGPAVLRGLDAIRVIAIGGVTPERAGEARDAGAWGVAAISALWRAPDPAAAVARMLVSLGG
jgi:thiamine-phosphate diphosphorylase